MFWGLPRVGHVLRTADPHDAASAKSTYNGDGNWATLVLEVSMAGIPLVSVIVPMYNVENYLTTCVDSILGQTLANIEVILVDDGSPDRCGQMADEYELRDSRVRVVHRENGGLGPARNSGLEVARGEYVGFVDSDDWVEPEMYEQLWSAASRAGAQVALTGIKTVSQGVVGEVREQPLAGQVLRGQDEIMRLRGAFYGAPPARVKDDPTPVSACVAIYLRSFLEEHGLRFVNMRSEDKVFNALVFREAQVVTAIGGAPYCYRKDDQLSITNSLDRRTIDSYFQLFEQLERMADEELPDYRDECRLREQRCVLDYCRVLIGTIERSGASEAEKREYVREVLSHQTLRRACRGYPFWKLPTGQAVFYVAMKVRSVQLVRALMRMRYRG